jgi:AraC-like DNA-binding protein
MKYKQLPPPAHLKKYIRYYWVLETEDDARTSNTMAPLADGCPGIIFQHSAEGSFCDPSDKTVPEIFLYGQTITPSDLRINGKFKTLGICFYPFALKSIFGFHASELTDSCVDLTLLMSRLKEPLLNACTFIDQIEIFSTSIHQQINSKNYPVDRAVEYALAEIVKSKGTVALKNLQSELKLSERGFQRRFDQQVGISPKLFSRVCQFQASLDQLKNNRYVNLSDVAFDNGYADQSHFIRSFKEFAGFSPYQFQKHERKLAENFSIF